MRSSAYVRRIAATRQDGGGEEEAGVERSRLGLPEEIGIAPGAHDVAVGVGVEADAPPGVDPGMRGAPALVAGAVLLGGANGADRRRLAAALRRKAARGQRGQEKCAQRQCSR